MARSAPAIPPLPAEGGTYELSNGQWICTQQTVEGGAAAADDQATPAEPQDDASLLTEAPPSGGA